MSTDASTTLDLTTTEIHHPLEEGVPENMASTTPAAAAAVPSNSNIRKKSMTSGGQKLSTASSTGGRSNSRVNQNHAHQHQQAFDMDSGGEDYLLNNSDSELSDTERNFLTKGAFLLTPSNELTLEKAGAICEKMNFRGSFSLTKTATGILFKFAEPDDCVAVYKKGFHKVTGARFYKKISIPCRPMRTFVVYALDVPEAVPVEDIRHALFKFQSVVEVSRVVSSPTGGVGPGGAGGVGSGPGAPLSAPSLSSITPQGGGDKGGATTSASAAAAAAAAGVAVGLPAAATNNAVAGYCPLVRITLGSQDEANTLLQNGLDFYGATFFPTEAARPLKKTSSGSLSGVAAAGTKEVTGAIIGTRIRELLPVFDATGFTKIPAPAERTIKPRN